MTGSPEPGFCPWCGGGLSLRFVPEEARERLVCAECSTIHYLNPKVVAGTIPVVGEKVWLLRRAIEPRLGWWTFPAGFMEMGESVEQAAARETLEELNLDVRLTRLLGVYSLPTMTTVHVVYLAEALSHPSLGSEALDFALFAPHEIPWDELAFWSTRAALEEWVRSLQSG